MGDECMPAGPGEFHEKLSPFEGTFRAEVKMWMGAAEPMVATGTMTNSFILGGRFLEQDYKGDDDGGPFPGFRGRGYWGYNDAAERYEGFWIDSVSNVMTTEAGTLGEDGRTWTMSGSFTNPSDGSTMSKRTIVKLEDRDHHTMEQFMVGPDGNEFKTMEISYARSS